MNCPYCNAKTFQEANYCSNCGKKINQNLDREVTKSQKQTSSYIIVLGMTIVSVFAVLLILASNIPKSEKNETTDVSSTQARLLNQITVLKNELTENPFDVSLNIKFANLLFDVQKFQEAKKYYRQALAIDPLQISAQIDLAICYYNMQQADSALIEMKKALKIDPNHSKGLFNIGVIYYNIGKIDEAKTYWTKLITLYEETEEAKRAKQLILNMQS
jgi:tetratricopeptide (TPR) repeat protein